MRVFEAINARIQNWQSMNFEKTKAGRKLRRLKGIHHGERCFIIGNGPSLRADDLQKLHENGVVTFAANRIYGIFDQTDWRPTYYTSEDIVIIRDVQEKINEIKAKAKFIPVNLKWYEGVRIDDADYFYMDYSSTMPETYNLSLNIPHGIRCKGTVTITAIQMAIYMGFAEIYLLGVDHSYAKMVNDKGEIIEDNSIRDYFCEDYDSGIKDELTHNVDGMTRAYLDVERLSRKMGSFRVYNATRGGRLEIFERVSFDELELKGDSK